jgi:hypothetical protein
MININLLLTSAIEAYLIALIYRNTRTSCLSLAALCSFVSHDSLNRLFHSSFPWSRRLWELFSSRMIQEGGYLLLDDTTWQRQAKLAEAVSKVWSSTAGERLSKKWPQRFGQACGHLKQVRAEVRIIKDGKRYFVTLDLSLSPAQIKRVYRNRQQIEETFKLLKQEFGWGGASVRKACAQTAHLHLGMMALCLTQQAALAQGQTVYAFKRDLFRQPIPNQLPFMDHFSVAA